MGPSWDASWQSGKREEEKGKREVIIPIEETLSLS